MRKNFFVRNYSACWKFFIKCRWHIVFTLGVFALLFLVGFTFPIFFREEIFSFINKLVLSLEGKSPFELMVFIFFNNLKASFFAIVTGIGLGLFPLFTGIFNGYILGFVAREAADIGGIWVLWQLLPHGIFELPAIIFSIGIGLKIGTDMFNGDVGKKLKYNLYEGLRFFAFVIFPLLLIAGIVEGLLIGFLG